MRYRPIRSRLFLPVIRMGLISDDWQWVAAIAFLGFMLPYLFWRFVIPIGFLFVPIYFWIGLIMTAAGYSFFFWIRKGRRPMWFQHRMRQLLEAPARRRTLPADWRDRNINWLKEK